MEFFLPPRPPILHTFNNPYIISLHYIHIIISLSLLFRLLFAISPGILALVHPRQGALPDLCQQLLDVAA